MSTTKTNNNAWINKSTGMLCDTCMFYAPKGIVNGRCRKHAPALDGWPVVSTTDWCGDHKLTTPDLDFAWSYSERDCVGKIQ